METAEQYLLSRDDVTAFRMAQRVAFVVRDDGTAYMRASLRESWTDETRIFTVREQRLFPATHDLGGRDRKVPCAQRVCDYHPNRPLHDERARYDCFYYDQFARQNDEWLTIAGAMRPGDQIQLEWTAGNDSPVMNAVGYHRDELRLKLANADGGNIRFFLVAVQVGPDNTARMVRQAYA